METIITIPSPSSFLPLPSPHSASSSPTITHSNPPTSSKKKSTAASRTQKSSGSRADAVTKPKQSKSRNGCVTCKAKRLKCDETKPKCQQCLKRGVECGGYKKDYKWRSIEETTFSGKPAPSKARKVSIKSDHLSPQSPATSDESASTTGSFPVQTPSQLPFIGFSPQPTFSQLQYPCISSGSNGLMAEPPIDPQAQQRYPIVSPIYQQSLPLNPDTIANGTIFGNEGQAPPTIGRPSGQSSGQSPRLIDLLLPGSDLNAPPGFMDYLPQQSDIPYQPGGYPLTNPAVLGDNGDGDDVEEIIRQPDPIYANSVMRLPSPSLSSSSSSSSVLPFDVADLLFNQPKLHPGSPEMLMLSFDKNTCGILSVKDGLMENPWRTLILPLINQSPALYHAISSMTAFHASKLDTHMKIEGMAHMDRSIHSLQSELQQDSQLSTALATTLVLAFAESWDVHVSTGIKHLKAAKQLIKHSLTKHQQNTLSMEDTQRLKFLCNTWVYMDVLARLTSVDDDDSNDFNFALRFSPGPLLESAEIDPLMGCANTLFPLIGQVANLVRKVRKSSIDSVNSIQIVSQASDLKTQIESWKAPISLEAPNDPTSEIYHSSETAEAYRWATLLYLHQAVPTIPSLSAAELAKRALLRLATVPLQSRVIIIHIYPLLAAGCEATSDEDRTWVADRWKAMSARMLIGNIDRCLEVVREVWARRDRYELERAQEHRRQLSFGKCGGYSSAALKLKRAFSAEEQDSSTLMERSNGVASLKRHATTGGGGLIEAQKAHVPQRPSAELSKSLEREKTVHGRLHWIGVMQDWNWEVLLG